MSNWYGAISRVQGRRPYRARRVVRQTVSEVAVPTRNVRARTAAYAMGLRVTRNRAPRAAVKGAIAQYGGRKELKYVDLAQATYACDTTGSVTALNLLAVGDDNTSRDGRQVTIKSVQLRGFVTGSDDNTSNNLARVLLVWDNANNSGAIATIAQILSAATSCSYPLVDNANRFTILWDSHYEIGRVSDTATQSFAGSPTIHAVNYYKKINQITQYSGTTAAIGSIQNGALLLVTIGSSAAGTGSAAVLASRVRFTDD